MRGKRALASFNSALEGKWRMTHIRPAKTIIGVDIDRSRNTSAILLTQPAEINKAITIFFKGDVNSVPEVLTPLHPEINSTDIGCDIVDNDESNELIECSEYRSLIGGLAYLRMPGMTS
jgi:hypothetical protein